MIKYILILLLFTGTLFLGGCTNCIRYEITTETGEIVTCNGMYHYAYSGDDWGTNCNKGYERVKVSAYKLYNACVPNTDSKENYKKVHLINATCTNIFENGDEIPCEGYVVVPILPKKEQNYTESKYIDILTKNEYESNYSDIVIVSSDNETFNSYIDIGYANYPHNNTPYVYVVCAENSIIMMNFTFCNNDESNCTDYNWTEFCKLGMKYE
jgi:hypothetical protein